MKHSLTTISKTSCKMARLGLVFLLSAVMFALASCSSRRAGISHNYDSPFGSGMFYVEGSDHGHGHKHKKPKKPKKPKHKKPKKHKHHKHHHDD
ncbi:MAG: hypothetical protein HDT07_01265 [Bacteroidales bacterium]|nr:hypothetical protein [Bacteroidales bacterium]